MYIPFQDLPDSARIWVYQASRLLSSQEMTLISANLTQSCQNWEAHGAPLQASYEIRYNQVITIAVNENLNAASGCSIDASTRWFKSLGESLQVDFFSRDVAVIRDERIQLIPLGQLKSAVSSGDLQASDKIITPLLQTLGEYRSQATSLVADSYLKRYF